MLRLTALILACLVSFAAAAQAQMRDMILVRDAEIEQTLRTWGGPVFRQAGIPPASVRFILVQSDALNAFVAGGQNIFFNTGLLMESENAAEVVGVLAHETGHIALGHLSRLADLSEDFSMQSMIAGLLGIAVAIGSGDGRAGSAISAAGQSMALGSALGHTRTHESSADEAGVRYLKEARLPMTGFLSFMKKLANQELLPASQQSEYVRTHPLTQDRIDYLEYTAKSAPASAFPETWDDMHARMKAKLLGYISPDRALQDKGSSPTARYGRAIAWYRKGQTDKSLELVNGLLAEEPENPWLYELKGQVLFEGGRVADSLSPYARAAELSPGTGLIRAAYGHALLESGKFDDAIRELDVSLTTEPRRASTHRFLAIAYGKKKQEGFSRLHLAEEYLLTGKPDLAKREAQLATTALPKTSASFLRAQDILDFVERADRDKNKKR